MTLPLLLADQSWAASGSWAPVVLLLIMGIGFVLMNLTISLIVGPHRDGPGKELAYESGVVPVGDSRRRFNVRFYVVAMIFLVFDVEIVFFYPFATIFASYMKHDAAAGTGAGTTMLVTILLFVAELLVAYVYAWGKGVFRWD